MEGTKGKRHERDVLLEFIHTYRDHPSLWKVKSEEYSNKIARSKGISALQDILKELEPDCTRDAVTRKINCLRTAFRREYRKIENSEKSGASTDRRYTPSLWYFDEMLFVLDQDLPRESCSNLDSINYLDVEITEGAAETEGDAVTHATSQVTAKRRRKTLPESNHVLDIVAKKLRDSTNKDESGNDAFGNYVARRLHSMDQRTALIARKLINDVLFEAEMGNFDSPSREAPKVLHTEAVPIPLNTSVYKYSSNNSSNSYDSDMSQ